MVVSAKLCTQIHSFIHLLHIITNVLENLDENYQTFGMKEPRDRKNMKVRRTEECYIRKTQASQCPMNREEHYGESFMNDQCACTPPVESFMIVIVCTKPGIVISIGNDQ